METLGAFLDGLAAQHGDREAIAYAARDTVTARMSWGALRDASRRAAKTLVAAGVTKGSRVGLLCSNRIDWLPIAFGALRIGAVLVPFSTLWQRDEIAYGLRHADVDLLITLPGFLKHDYLASLRDIVPELGATQPGHLYSACAPALRRVVLLDGEAPGAERWDALGAPVDDGFLDRVEASVVPADWATIFFTSGTTAQAKAVVHRHSALTTSARRLSACFGVTSDDAWWGHMSLFWSGGFMLALATLAGGARLVLQEVVEPGSALALLEREGCTLMAGWHQALPLLEHPDFGHRRLRLKKGTYHPLAPRLLGPDHVAVGVYGMSETATGVTAARWDDPEDVRTATYGRRLDGMEVRIVDPDTGQPVSTGTRGEILVKGPTVMDGYYKVPRANTFDAQGFFKTGDLASFDAAGYLHFATRLKDVIKTAGVNVAATEVEEALARHPAVQSAHVVAVPDPARGENIAAFVVLHDAQTVTAGDLRAFCRGTLASYKVPRHVFTIAASDVPRTGSGKVDKASLRRAAALRRDSHGARS